MIEYALERLLGLDAFSFKYKPVPVDNGACAWTDKVLDFRGLKLK